MANRGVLTVAGAFGIDTNVYPASDRVGTEMTFAHRVERTASKRPVTPEVLAALAERVG